MVWCRVARRILGVGALVMLMSCGSGSSDGPTPDALDGACAHLGLSGSEGSTTERMAPSFGEVLSHGDGVASFTGLTNSKGSLGEAQSADFDYVIGSDGRLTLDAPLTLQGGVSPSGAYAFVAGGTVAGQSPALMLFVRK